MKLVKILFVCLGVGLFLGFLYKFYVLHLAAFGCFDDCFNYGAGYFINHGKLLYRDIFFNHQPLAAYITAGIQYLTKPINIYQLLLRHRQFLFLVAFFFDSLIIVRFGIAGIFFTIGYESTKWYLFGDRFLSEGMIVYPLVYITAICLQAIKKIRISQKQGIFVALCTWFILFSREPYIPLVLFLFCIFIFQTKNYRSLFLFIILCTLTMLVLPIPFYIDNVITTSSKTVFKDSLSQMTFTERLRRMIGYPLLVAFTNHISIFWQFVQKLSFVFLILLILNLVKRQFKKLIFIVCVLVLANSRAVAIDTVFYQGFQLLPWFALFLFLTGSLIQDMYKESKKTGIIFLTGSACIMLVLALSPQFWIKEKTSGYEELITNYSTEIQYGNAIHELSSQRNTLFLDGWAELMFWQADRMSAYKYSWYTSVMPLLPKYSQARIAMFKTTPPDFYFGSCPKETNDFRLMPTFIKDAYTNIPMDGEASCLWIKTNKLSAVTDTQWKKAKELHFDKPATLPLVLVK